MLTSSSMNMASSSAKAPTNSCSRSCRRLRIGSRRSDRRASAPDVFKRGGEANISGKAHRKSPQNRSKVTQDIGCFAACSVWRGVKAFANAAGAVMLPSPVKLRLLRMNEGIYAEGTASELQDRVTELVEQQTAISEVLRAIVNSPHDLQPIFDAILDSSKRLCRADVVTLRLSEESGLRLVAMRGDPLLVSHLWSSFPALAEKGSLQSRIATSRLPAHIPDLAALEGDHRDHSRIAAVNAGYRATLIVPLLKDNELVGTITLGRKQVQPFTDKQISLFRDFAAQATIALESTRLERQYREAQMALAHANRVATMGQLTASITHEVNQPITAAVTYALAARRFLSADPPNFREVDDALSLIVKEGNR